MKNLSKQHSKMTEGSRPSPKSAMKVVMNSRVIMVTVEH